MDETTGETRHVSLAATGPSPLDRSRQRDASLPRSVDRAVRPGVLSLQGSVEPHVEKFTRLGYDPVEVRLPAQLEQVTHLILPGGESTTFAKLLQFYGLWEPIVSRASRGDLAVFGTCAGAILLGRSTEERPPRMNLLDVAVDRNAYGRQIDSFVAPLDCVVDDCVVDDCVVDDRVVDHGLASDGACSNRVPLAPLEGVFIRAPRLGEIGAHVEVLATYGGEPVLVIERRIMAGTFHPELTATSAVHEYFLSI